MTSSDLTILFLTANLVPKGWAEYQKSVLLEAADGLPIITISREPVGWGYNLIDDKPRSISNIYYQMLRGAHEATTEYVAVAEDDTLYPRDHFHSFRPPTDTFSYNINRIGLFTWGRPTYFWKYRQSNATLVAPRKLLIEALEERFTKWPNGTPTSITGEVGRKNIERALGTSHYKNMEFQTDISVLRVDHDLGTDTLAKSHRKGMGIVRSYDVPHWGRAEDIVKKFT